MRLISHDRLRRIVGLSKRLEELSDAKRELLRQLVDLEAQAHAVRVERNALQNLEAPIAELPDEVLAMIFEEGMHLSGTSKSDHFGVLVSHVTQHWRTIALRTPKLWTDIQFIAQDVRLPYPEKFLERASTFIFRARSLPLDISIRYFHGVHFSSNFLQLIGDHIGRCRQLHIVYGDHNGLMTVLNCISSKPMPLLAAIILDYDSDAITFHKQLFPSGVPSLTTAYIANINVQTMHFCLPAFEFLATLALPSLYIPTDVEYELFRDALMALPSLRYLELIVDIFDAQSSPGLLPILLPTIEHLQVECEGTSDLRGVLCCIQAASLVGLSLLVWDDADTGPFAPDADVVDFPSLQHLVLTNLAAPVPTLVAFARNFPHIEHLTFQPVKIANPWLLHDIDTILSMLCGADDGDRAENNAHIGPLWPKLQSFAFSPSTEDFDVPKLQSTILKLQAAGHPIRRLLLPRKTHPALVGLGEMIEIEEFYVDWPTPFD